MTQISLVELHNHLLTAIFPALIQSANIFVGKKKQDPNLTKLAFSNSTLISISGFYFNFHLNVPIFLQEIKVKMVNTSVQGMIYRSPLSKISNFRSSRLFASHAALISPNRTEGNTWKHPWNTRLDLRQDQQTLHATLS